MQMFTWLALEKEADRFIKRHKSHFGKFHHKFFLNACLLWLLSWAFQLSLQPCLFHFESYWGNPSHARLLQVKHWVRQDWRAAGRTGILVPDALFLHYIAVLLALFLYHELSLILPASTPSKSYLPDYLLGQCLASLCMCSYYWNLILHSRMLEAELASYSVGY